MTSALLYGLGALGLLGLLARLISLSGGGTVRCVAGRYGLPVKAMNVSHDFATPLKLAVTASNCYLGVINMEKKEPDPCEAQCGDP